MARSPATQHCGTGPDDCDVKSRRSLRQGERSQKSRDLRPRRTLAVKRGGGLPWPGSTRPVARWHKTSTDRYQGTDRYEDIRAEPYQSRS